MELEEQLGALKASLDAKTRNLSEMQSTTTRLLSDLQLSQAEVARVTANAETQLKTLAAQMQAKDIEYQTSLRQAQQQINESARIRQAETLAHACLLQVKESEITRLQSERQSAHDQLALQQRTVEQLQDRLTIAGSKVSEEQTRNQLLQRQIEESTLGRLLLENELASVHQLRQDGEKRIDEQRTRIIALEDTELRQSHEIEELAQQLVQEREVQESQRVTLLERHEDMQTKLVQAQTSARRVAIKHAEEMNQLSKRHDAVVDTVKAAQAENVSLRRQMDESPDDDSNTTPRLGKNGEPSTWGRNGPMKVYYAEVARLADILVRSTYSAF